MASAAESRKNAPLWVRLLVPKDAPMYERNEAIAGWLMVIPALFVLTLFLVVPFIMAFIMSFTNQRLVSPNPTEWVGMRKLRAAADGSRLHAGARSATTAAPSSTTMTAASLIPACGHLRARTRIIPSLTACAS